MATKATEEAKNILKEALKELESPKGSILAGIQKLSRAANILDDEDTYIWCEIQLGNSEYVSILKEFIPTFVDYNHKYNDSIDENEQKAIIKKLRKELDKINEKLNINYSLEEIAINADKSGGGCSSIGFIEERYNDLVRMKKGNDRTYYKANLHRHILYVRKKAHDKANRLYNKITFSDAPQTAFDILKEEIDDKLLDLDPELAEKLMLAFRGVTTNNPEEWSQALTTCRRLIEKLADNLYPPTNKKINGRELGKDKYINRIWAFMDKSIKSESDRGLAKAHVDFLGKYLEALHKKTHKGVHATVKRDEAVKTVIHTYLMIGDILNYLEKLPKENRKLNIHKASLDELESILGVRRNIAKEIIKLRVEEGTLDEKKLGSIKGIGPKTIAKAKEAFSFDSEGI